MRYDLNHLSNPADVLLLEVGLGGRVDSTNVIDKPALSVITPVGLDHQHFLGDTIEEIAFEKAGILKPGVPCVVGPQADAARAIGRNDLLPKLRSKIDLYRNGKPFRIEH